MEFRCFRQGLCLPMLWKKGTLTLADPRLQKNYNVAKMTQMVACAAVCVRHLARGRLSMSQTNSLIMDNYLGGNWETKEQVAVDSRKKNPADFALWKVSGGKIFF